jgi:polar amino acid transport system substrate-binding protein
MRALFRGVALATALCVAVPAIAAASPLFERLPASVKSTRTITLVGDSFPPYRIVGEDGKTVTGVETDLARALEPILGVHFKQVIVSNLPAILAGIDTGRYDLSSGPLLATKEREQRYDIVTWLVSKPAFLLPTAGGHKTSTLEDLCGLRISYAAGPGQEPYLRKLDERCVAAKRPVTHLVALADQNAAVLAAQAGRSDVASMQLAAGLYLQRQNPGKFQVQTDQTNQLGILHLGFVMKKNSPLTPVLDDALKQLWASGEYARILEKWGLAPAKADAPRVNPNSQ